LSAWEKLRAHRLPLVRVPTPGVDYRAFELSTDLDRVEAEPVALSADQEAWFERLIEATVCISLHDHLEVDPLEPAATEAWIREGRIATG
jgi:hypothetical protein